MKKIKDLFLSNDPEIETRAVLPYENIEDKNKKQFETTKDSKLIISFTDNTCLTLYAEAGYKYDGATIPFNIGKGDMRLQIPALFHDIICENKKLVDYDRKLSSTIFRELLIACEVSKFMAYGMYFAVDNYQRLFCDWKRKDE